MSVRKLLAAMSAIVVVLSMAVAAQAANVYFSSAVPGDWNVGSNWNTGTVPTSADVVSVGSGETGYVYQNVDCTLPAGVSGAASTFTVGHAGTGTFTMAATAGTLTVANHIRIGRNQASWGAGNGTVYQLGGAISQTSSTAGRTLGLGWVAGDSGTYNMSGGSISLNGGGGLQVGIAGAGEFNLTGGTINSKYLYIAGFAAADTTGQGLMDIDGGSLSLSQNAHIGYAGEGKFDISGGTFSVAGTVAVGNGATGSGEFKIEDATAMITWSGSSATFGARSTLSYVAGTGGVSSIQLTNTSTGALNINDAAVLSFDLSAMSSAVNDILLVDNYGTDAISGTFATYGEGATVHTFGDGSYYTLTYVYDAATTLGAGHDVAAANDLALVAHAIPEPSALTLLACGLIGLLAYAWRKR